MDGSIVGVGRAVGVAGAAQAASPSRPRSTTDTSTLPFTRGSPFERARLAPPGRPDSTTAGWPAAVAGHRPCSIAGYRVVDARPAQPGDPTAGRCDRPPRTATLPIRLPLRPLLRPAAHAPAARPRYRRARWSGASDRA